MPCPRCRETTEFLVPWRGWKPALYVWYAAMVLLTLVFPIMASDYCVMIPMMMGIILAGSPLHRLAKERPVCSRCSFEQP